jgi:Lipase (class 3)
MQFASWILVIFFLIFLSFICAVQPLLRSSFPKVLLRGTPSTTRLHAVQNGTAGKNIIAVILPGIGTDETTVSMYPQQLKHLLEKVYERKHKGDSLSTKLNVTFVTINWKLHLKEDQMKEIDFLMPHDSDSAVNEVKKSFLMRLADLAFYVTTHYKVVLTKASKQINEKLHQLKKENGKTSSKIYLIGYSLGGLVANDLIQSGLISEEVDVLIAVGSPLAAFERFRGKKEIFLGNRIRVFNIFYSLDFVASLLGKVLKGNFHDRSRSPFVYNKKTAVNETTLAAELKNVVDIQLPTDAKWKLLWPWNIAYVHSAYFDDENFATVLSQLMLM